MHIPNWQGQYQADEWLEVSGQFSLGDTNDGQQIILRPDNITPIDIPENPYAN